MIDELTSVSQGGFVPTLAYGNPDRRKSDHGRDPRGRRHLVGFGLVYIPKGHGWMPWPFRDQSVQRARLDRIATGHLSRLGAAFFAGVLLLEAGGEGSSSSSSDSALSSLSSSSSSSAAGMSCSPNPFNVSSLAIS